MPGGFHPFHAGHADLYQQAKKAFPGADIYVAATNDQSERPFPFALKEKLAKLAGVESGHFVQVKSPFQAKEITQHYNPEQDVLIFVRSEKDRNEPPKPGGTKKDGSPSYFQPYTGKDMQPFSQHAYIDYLKTVEFGPGITSATQIRNAWPTLNDKRKTALVMSLYPAVQQNLKLAQNVVGMFDQVMGSGLSEGEVIPFARKPQAALTWQQVPKDVLKLANDWFWADDEDGSLDAVLDPKGYGSGTRNDVQYIAAQLQQRGWAIEHDLDDNTPGAFNMKLSNKRGQSVLLPWEDAQSFTGWAQGTNSHLREQGVEEAKKKRRKKSPRPMGGYFFPGYAYYGSSEHGDGSGGGEGVAEGSEAKDDLIWMLNNFDYYTDDGNVYANDNGDKIARVGSEWKHQSGKRGRGAEELGNFLSSMQGVAEGDENIYRRPTAGEASRIGQQTQAKLNPKGSKFIWKKPNQIGGSYSEQDLATQGFKKSQYNSWGGTQSMWDRLLSIKEDEMAEARVLFTDPNTKVNVYYNSKNPKYYGKPVQVGKGIPYNKIDQFINMIVSKYQVKPTEFVWSDSRSDRTDAHIVHEVSDYLEEK
jgi:hypothetical protein